MMARKSKTIAILTTLVFALTLLMGGLVAQAADRVGGTDRSDTAFQVANEVFGGTADTVVIAEGRNMADSMVGNLLAGALNSPILIWDSHMDKDYSVIAGQVAALGATNAYVLGGEAAIPAELVNELTGVTVTRVQGADRFLTSAEVIKTARVITSPLGTTLYVANGRGTMDGESMTQATGFALAPATDVTKNLNPVLLTDKNNPGNVLNLLNAAELNTGNVDKVIILGNTDEVPSEVTAALIDAGFNNVSRLNGDLFDVAANLATGYAAANNATNAVIARGDDVADALAAGILGAQNNAPLLFTNPDALPAATLDALAAISQDGSQGFIVGGPSAVSDDVAGNIEKDFEKPAAPTVDKAALEAKIADAKALVEADYTAETWAALQTAVADAEAVVANEEATQEEVDAALAELKAKVEALVEAPVGLAVESVSAINKTTVEATLAAGFDATRAADKAEYNVKVGTEQVTVSAVSLAGSKATLTVDLDGKQGKVSVNGTESATAVDYKKPGLVGAEATNAKTIIVTFDEAVEDATALVVANYTLFNKATGQTRTLQAGAPGALPTDTDVQAAAGFANTEKTQVKLTILATSAAAGFPMGGLADVDYVLYVKNVKDTATPANTIVENSFVQFKGSLAPSTDLPNVTKASYDNAARAITLQFDQAVVEAVPANNAISVKAGEQTVGLVSTDYDSTSFDAATKSVIDFKLTAAGAQKIAGLGDNFAFVLAKGAFKRGTVESAATEVTPSTTTSPRLIGFSYDELTNIATYKFSSTIDVSKLGFAAAKVYIDNVDIYDANIKLVTTQNSDSLQIQLSDAKAQAIEPQVRVKTKAKAKVAAGTVTDTQTPAKTNVAESSEFEFTVGTEYVKDTVAPEFTGATYKAGTQTLELTFSEKIAATIGNFVRANIEIYKDDNGTPGLQTTGTNPDSKVTDFNTDGVAQGELMKADGTGAITPGTETATIYVKNAAMGGKIDTAIATNKDIYVLVKKDAVQDPSGNKIASNTSAKVTVDKASGNVGAITSATTASSLGLGAIEVVFKNAGGNVAMDRALATNAANFSIKQKANPLNILQIDGVFLSQDQTTATLFLRTPAQAGVVYQLTTANLKTAAGKDANIDGTLVKVNNTGDVTPTAAAIAFNGAPATAPTVTDVDGLGTLNAGDKLTFKSNVPVQLPAGFSVNDITITAGAPKTLGTGATISLGEDKMTLTIVLGTAPNFANADTITFPTTVKDYAGNALTGVTGVTQAIAGVPAAAVAPKVRTAIYSDVNGNGIVDTGDTLTLGFDQDLDTTVDISALAKTDFSANNATTAGSAGIGSADLATFTASYQDNRTIILTFATDPVLNIAAAKQVMDGALHVQAVAVIKNALGTVAAAGADNVKVTPLSKEAPKVTEMKYKAATKELTFVFDKAVNDEIKTTADALAAELAKSVVLVSNGGTVGTAASAKTATLATDKRSITITLNTDAALDASTKLTLKAAELTPAATDRVQDAYGNAAVRGSADPYTLTIVE